jgi:hypothetical protein
MFSSFCKLSLTLILRCLDRILPPARPALPTAPTKSAAPPIDLTPDQVEQITVAEGVVKIQALQFAATPVIAPAFGGEPLSRTDPAPVKIVSWTELPEAVPGADSPAQDVSLSSVSADCETPAALTRGQLVEGLLDEAWQQGLRTYAQLMKYIELQTGTACSKRVVSAWKKSRQRTEAEAA